MICQLSYKNTQLCFDTDIYYHISFGLQHGSLNPQCFYLPQPVFTPFVAGEFIGSTDQGGNCNCYTLTMSPHGNGTHTECIGHIISGYTIHQCLRTLIMKATLISVTPELNDNKDYIITKQQISQLLHNGECEALIIRTLPNGPDKSLRQYSGTNPPYFSPDALEYCVEHAINHILVDLPSVDREEDGGRLAAHKAFWNYPTNPRLNATITELIYVDNSIPDGEYILMHNIAPLESDASPSRPIIFPLMKEF